MPIPEYPREAVPLRDGPPPPVPLPPELADFLRGQDLVALWHASDAGTLLVLKAREPELESLGGTFPVELDHQLWRHPAAPVVRSLITFHDQPDSPLRLETFTNVGDPDQREAFAALGGQEEIHVLGYDEHLRHRLTKGVTHGAAEFIPTIVAEADRLLATIPPERRDFDRAKAAVMEVTKL
jgi:hypothetical protein